MNEFLKQWGEGAFTSWGFFWKSGWVFVLSYAISAMIQVFVPKVKMIPYVGSFSIKSISLSTIFGSISSSCSFTALVATRSLFKKGAHFVTTVAFMFASTNLVIKLGYSYLSSWVLNMCLPKSLGVWYSLQSVPY